MMGTSRNSLCLPHVCRCMYPDFVTCEDQSAHRTTLSAPLFLEQNIKHIVGPDLGPTVCKISLSQPLWGGGGGLGPVLLIVSAADKGTGTCSRTWFEIKEADYQTTCCCFKTRVARGGNWRTKTDLSHQT